MKKSIKTKLEKLVSVLNDLKIDVSGILFTDRDQLYEASDTEQAQFLKNPHILQWSVRELKYVGRVYHNDCFIYCLQALVGIELYMYYYIECDTNKDCKFNYIDGKNSLSNLGDNLFETGDIDTPYSLSKKLDDYIQIYSK